MRFLCFVIVILSLTTELVQAQSFYALRRPRNLLVHGGTGTTHYKGDLQDPKKLLRTRFNIVAGAEYFVLPRVSVRAELAYFRLAGSDAVSEDQERKDRNLSFFSDNIELSAVGTLNLLPTPPKFYQRPILNLFGFGGFGVLFFNPKTTYNGETVKLQEVRTEGVFYSRFQPVILGGMGIKYMYNPFINFILEVGYRISFTDYLDDVSRKRYNDHPTEGNYLDPTDQLAINLNKRATGPAGVRGNPDNKDGYLLINFKVQYYLKKQIFAGSDRKLYNQKRKAYYRRR